MNPFFDGTPKIAQAQVTTGDTSRTSLTSGVNLVTGAANGSKVKSVKITAVGTTTAGMIRFWVYDTSNNRLFDEVTVTAITPDADTPAFSWVWIPPTELVLLQNWILKAQTHNTETFNLVTSYGDY